MVAKRKWWPINIITNCALGCQHRLPEEGIVGMKKRGRGREGEGGEFKGLREFGETGKRAGQMSKINRGHVFPFSWARKEHSLS